MLSPTPLEGWLAGLDEVALARVLANRPDTLLAPEPRSIRELAERLDRPDSLVGVLRRLPLPCVQLSEAIQALGGAPPLPELTSFIDDGSQDHPSQLARWFQVLADHAIARWTGDGLVVAAGGLAQIFPTPLGLGPSLRALLGDVNVDQLRRILKTLGLAEPPTRRAAVVDEVLGVLTDPEFVRGIVATAPKQISQELYAWAFDRDAAAADSDAADDDLVAAPYDPAAYQRRVAASKWGIDRGLVYARSWSYGWRLPAEVKRALRGPEFRAPFTPEVPPADLTVISTGELASHAGAAVARFASLMLAVVDRLARTALPALKTGGVGARELGKLAKAVGCTEPELRLCLELGSATEVIDRVDAGYGLGGHAEQWREAAPADRVASLIWTWWRLPGSATQSRDDDSKALPALRQRECLGCLYARHNLLKTMAELGEGNSASSTQVAARASWRRPFVHVLAEDTETPFASIFAEATGLGLVAAGALTPLGHALVGGDADAVHDLLAAILPPANDQALFGADLTVVVTGAPTAGLSRLLDAAADRESSGAATVWRFTPGSIRRALDEGITAADLQQGLSEIATTELPQPLRYLIGDLGRQHGNLQVSPSVSVIRSDDTALLTQVAHDKALRRLGLRVLAPTVLGCDAEPAAVLAAMRKAGYLPMPDSGAQGAQQPPPPGSLTPDHYLRAARVRTATRLSASAQAPADPGVLAGRLLSRPAAAAEPASPTEQALRAAGATLTASEIRILAHAVDGGGFVAIDYRSTSGNLTHRVISAPDMSGDMILAWCELRADERWFRIDRIQGVVPAG